MPFVNVNGLKTFYESRGRGKALLLVHGANSDSRIWINQLSELSKKLRVVAIDLPGHGKSERLRGKGTIERYAEHVAAFMKEVKLDNATILGTSMGGLVVQKLYLNHPELFEKLIVHDCGARLPLPSDYADLYRKKHDFAVRQLTPLSFSRKTLKRNPAFVHEHIQQGLETDPDVAGDDYEAVTKVDFTDESKRISIPTLVVAGLDDPVLSPARSLRENIKGSKFETIADAGHVNMLEKPDEFNRIVLDFICS